MSVMRKVVVGASVVALVVVATGTLLGAQGRSRMGPPIAGRTIIEGVGSEIGASVRDLRADEIQGGTGGALVQDVREGGPAARAGLRSGDIVVEFDGERVRGARHFSRMVRETPAGRPVKSTVVREGSERTVDIVPEASSPPSLADLGPAVEQGLRALYRAFSPDAGGALAMPWQWSQMPRGRLGVSVSPLTDQLALFFGVTSGVLISSVEPGSPAADGGIRAGDVITAVNGRTVDGVPDLVRQIQGARPGSALEVRLSREKREVTVTVTLPGEGEDRRDDQGGWPV